MLGDTAGDILLTFIRNRGHSNTLPLLLHSIG
jgi:hypothetical protein